MLKMTETGQNENPHPSLNFMAEMYPSLSRGGLLWEIVVSWSYCHSSTEDIVKSAAGLL